LASIRAGSRGGILTDEFSYSSGRPRRAPLQATDIAGKSGIGAGHTDLARLLRKRSGERSTPWSPPPPSPSSGSSSSPSWTASR